MNPSSSVKLYKWQRDCLRAWEENGRRGIAHVVTGAGKTRMALEAIRRFRGQYPNARIRIVVPAIPLAWQWYSLLLREAAAEPEQPGFFGGGRRDESDRAIMIYIINSARENLPQHMEQGFALGQPQLLICDECHHYQSRENSKIFGYRMPPFYPPEQFACLGLSATPFESEQRDILQKGLGKVIYHYGFSAAVEEGIVSPFIVVETAASFLPDERRQYTELSREMLILRHKMIKKYPWLKFLEGKAFIPELNRLARRADMDPADPAAAYLLKSWERKTVSNLARSRIQCALAILQALHRDTRVILFCERISQAESMLALLKRTMGHTGVLYHSKMSWEARERNLGEFRDGRVRVLISCRALDEGIDVPDAAVAIAVSSSSVTRQRIQRLGRILRPSEGKAAASMYYIYLPESADESIYLPGLRNSPRIKLYYDSEEKGFSHGLYEYMAREVMAEAAQLSPESRREIRSCLLEGLPRTDYLLPSHILAGKKGSSTHENNYWKVMRRINRLCVENDGPE